MIVIFRSQLPTLVVLYYKWANYKNNTCHEIWGRNPFKDLMFAVESTVLWWLWPQGSVGSPGLLLSVDLQGQCVYLTVNKYDFYQKNPVDLLCLKIFLFSSNCEKHFCRIVKKQPEVFLKFTYEQVPLGVHICSWASPCLLLLVMCHYDSTDSGNHFLIECYCQVNKPLIFHGAFPVVCHIQYLTLNVG